MTNKDYFTRKGLALYDFKNKEQAVIFLMKEMIIKLFGLFKYENLPDNIKWYHIENYLLRGHCEFIEHEGELWPMMGGLCGVEKSPVYDFTQATIANPALNISKTFTHGEDCVIVRNDPLFCGVYEILRRYCSIQAEANLSLYLWASYGSRLTSLISAQDDDTRKSADNFIEDIIRGEYKTVAESDFFDGVRVNPLTSGQSNSLLQLLELLQYNQAEMYKAFGLSSNNNRKRESLSSDETSTDDAILLPTVDVMETCRQEGIELVNSLFNRDIKVSRSSSWELIEEEMEAIAEELENVDENMEEETEEEKEEAEEKKDDETDA